MKRKTLLFKEQGVTAQYSIFGENHSLEMHVIFHVEPRGELFEGQYSRVKEAFSLFLSNYPTFKPIFKRFFLSDATNQSPLIPKEQNCCVSIIQQPPLDGSKLAVWCYLATDVKVKGESGKVSVEHGSFTDYFHGTMYDPSGDSYHQTKKILESYEKQLTENEMTMTDNCLRTWFFIRDVDTQYAGMVKARRENFVEQGLTEKTHYIASTGIGGNPAHPSALVQMDAYSVKGLKPNQFKHLYASTHLNPTYEYGVTFERGTVVLYGNRSHVLISGTASIDNKGNVLYVGNVEKQCHRLWENVEMLLKEGGATFDDVTQMIVYLRDGADYEMIKELYQKRFPEHPVVFTLAPVCRPTWLIEMECQAITEKGNSNFENF